VRRMVLFGGIVVGVLLLLGAALAVGVLIGKNNGPSSRTNAPGSAVEEEGSDVGSTKTVGELRLTLEEAFRTEGEDDNDRSQLPPDGTFVVTRFRVQNFSAKTITFGKPYRFDVYSTDGPKLNDSVVLGRQIDTTAPREDRLLYRTEIRPNGDVTGTVVFVAERDDVASVEFYTGLYADKPAATWEFGPVGELPERAFKSQV
jgi:Domain of unknown function (DUF4352)